MKRKSILLRCFAIVLVYSCLGMQQVSAQDWDHEYVPFVEEGKVWNCISEDSYLYGPYLIDCIFTMHGDTLIGNHSYKKVLCQYEKCYGDNEQHYYCAVREEAYQVFFVAKDASEESLLCDFSSPSEIKVMTHGDITFARYHATHIDGYPTKQYEFMLCAIIDGEANPSYGYGGWLEGVGSIYGGTPFDGILGGYDQTITPRVDLMSCKVGEKYIFKEGWLAQPSSVTSSTERTAPQKELFDLQGRRLQGEPKHGVYIQNGKKVMR